MSDAPERIGIEGADAWWVVTCTSRDASTTLGGTYAEYVRADIHEAAVKRAEEAESDRDEWARQCNMVSEAQADALNALSLMRNRAEKAEHELAEQKDHTRDVIALAQERLDKLVDAMAELEAIRRIAEERLKRSEKAEAERDELRHCLDHLANEAGQALAAYYLQPGETMNYKGEHALVIQALKIVRRMHEAEERAEKAEARVKELEEDAEDRRFESLERDT